LIHGLDLAPPVVAEQTILLVPYQQILGVAVSARFLEDRSFFSGQLLHVQLFLEQSVGSVKTSKADDKTAKNNIGPVLGVIFPRVLLVAQQQVLLLQLRVAFSFSSLALRPLT
jgi:hypothetical protein